MVEKYSYYIFMKNLQANLANIYESEVNKQNMKLIYSLVNNLKKLISISFPS